MNIVFLLVFDCRFKMFSICFEIIVWKSVKLAGFSAWDWIKSNEIQKTDIGINGARRANEWNTKGENTESCGGWRGPAEWVRRTSIKGESLTAGSSRLEAYSHRSLKRRLSVDALASPITRSCALSAAMSHSCATFFSAPGQLSWWSPSLLRVSLIEPNIRGKRSGLLFFVQKTDEQRK